MALKKSKNVNFLRPSLIVQFRVVSQKSSSCCALKLVNFWHIKLRGKIATAQENDDRQNSREKNVSNFGKFCDL
jgi:hypothetical protein